MSGLHTALAENRKRNPQPQRGAHLCRRHFHFESGNSRNGQPLGFPFHFSARRFSKKKYKTHFVKKKGEEEISTKGAVKQLQEYVNVPLVELVESSTNSQYESPIL